jgi:hypothetical protein
VGGVLGDAAQNVGQPSLRIDVIHLGGRDQRHHDGGAIGAAVRASEEP